MDKRVAEGDKAANQIIKVVLDFRRLIEVANRKQ